MTRTAAQPLDDRRAPRNPMRVAATLDGGPAHRIPVVVIDISACGTMVETHAPLLPGRPVGLTMTGLDRRPARIVWARDARLGIAFDRPLTLPELLRIV